MLTYWSMLRFSHPRDASYLAHSSSSEGLEEEGLALRLYCTVFTSLREGFEFTLATPRILPILPR